MSVYNFHIGLSNALCMSASRCNYCVIVALLLNSFIRCILLHDNLLGPTWFYVASVIDLSIDIARRPAYLEGVLPRCRFQWSKSRLKSTCMFHGAAALLIAHWHCRFSTPWNRLHWN